MDDIHFKPEFGNDEHIRIVGMIGELKHKKTLLERKINEYMALRNLKKEISELEKSIRSFIKTETTVA